MEITSSKEKNQKIETLFNSIEKVHGKGSVQVGDSFKADVDVLCSYGSIAIDAASGIGGVPRGRVGEIYGPESSGKTTLTLNVIAQAQKKGNVCAFIDAEHAFDKSWAKKQGVNTDKLIFSQPDSGEDALQIAQAMVESGVVDLIIIDSVSALTPKAELNGEIGDSHMGLQARMMSQALRILTPKISKSKCAVIFINQIRSKIGVMFGSPETTSGGNALKFFASYRIDVRNPETSKTEEGQTSKVLRATFKKNKLAPPFKQGVAMLHTNDIDNIWGFDLYTEMIEIGSKYDIVKKAGAWYSYNEERLGQGKPNAAKALRSNSAMAAEIYMKINDVISKEDIIEVDSASDSFEQEIAKLTSEKRTRRSSKDTKQDAIEVEAQVE